LPLAKNEVSSRTSVSLQVANKDSLNQCLRILIADDNQDAAYTLSTLLSVLGHHAAFAHDGKEALEMATSKDFDLIILDLGMPGLNGYEVATEIRKLPHLQKTMLAALTGWGSESDRQRTKEAGFDAHLIKPAAPTEIEKLLSAAHNAKQPLL
jgi:CheY-like chemotaxis protein